MDALTDKMQLLKIPKYPFSLKELTDSFRTQISLYHPDKYKKEDANEKAGLIISAYKELKQYAATTDVKKIIKEKAMFDFTKTCVDCEGSGFTIEDVLVSSGRYDCFKCEDTGIYVVKCKWCDNGRFIQKNGKEVSCKSCSGTGLFKMKCNHKMSFQQRLYNDMFTNKKYIKKRVKCNWCGGTGETKFVPVNPVISKGAILK